MAGVAIFVDYENLTFVLQRREYCRLRHQKIGEALLQYARQFGAIEQATMWAEWDRFQSNKRHEQSAQAILTALGFDCLYLLRPSDRGYTEQAILKKVQPRLNDLKQIILVSGDYTFPELLSQIDIPTSLVLLSKEGAFVANEEVDVVEFADVVDSDEVLSPLQTPHGMEPAAFYIWMQRVLQEELRRRSWHGMSFHMLARLLVERNLCEEDVEAQFYINQAVREGFLERSETELPTGRRILLKPTIVERANDPVWSFDEEFRWAQLIWALEMILSRNPWWEYVTFSRLREELEKWSLVTGSDELQQMVEEAVEKGIYKLNVEEGGPPLFRKKYKYTLGDVGEMREKFRELPLLILQTMRGLLELHPHWHGVSFSKLLDELDERVRHAEQKIWVDRQRLKDWCNFLVAIGFLHAFRGRPRVVDGELRDPPTLLRIVPEHPWLQHLGKITEEESVVPEEEVHDDDDLGPKKDFTLRRLDYYRLIVVIEHYLHISNNDAVVAGWMPMSTLFHVMGRSLERSFCNAVVRSAREKGIIEIRTHDPRPGQHPARGAHLELDHPDAVAARKRVLRLLDIIQSVQDRNGVAELYTLEARLREDPFFGEEEDERLGWIELMREENLILVRPHTGTEDEGTTRYLCTLNFRDRYVLALLERLYPSSKGSFASLAAASEADEKNTTEEDIDLDASKSQPYNPSDYSKPN
ncbi:MAG: hypothetical protein CL920_05325 [Deltaproteobacteria bacterium]|nr:hypothetical protein [Deltaproteobacteria bacterium]MBU48103.1 hypothetical protein [Deltaproteobacteria bacterium]|tara:strand:+ start:24179 stop:26275 length:2097 start_codon:yes stop_codon:yes gene_type:complete